MDVDVLWLCDQGYMRDDTNNSDNRGITGQSPAFSESTAHLHSARGRPYMCMRKCSLKHVNCGVRSYDGIPSSDVIIRENQICPGHLERSLHQLSGAVVCRNKLTSLKTELLNNSSDLNPVH